MLQIYTRSRAVLLSSEGITTHQRALKLGFPQRTETVKVIMRWVNITFKLREPFQLNRK